MKRSRVDLDQRFQLLLEELKDTKRTTQLARLNKNLAGSQVLMEELSVGDPRKLHEDCREEIDRILVKILKDAKCVVGSIQDYTLAMMVGDFESDHGIEDRLQRLRSNGIKTCISFALAGEDISQVMMWLQLCALSLKQYRGFVTAFQKYKHNKNDISALFSLSVTPVTTVLISESAQRALLFYSDKHHKCILASLMSEKIVNAGNKSKAMKVAPDFISHFGKSVESNSQSPLVADGTMNVFWERSKTVKKTDKSSKSSDMRQIRKGIKELLSTFAGQVQLYWGQDTTEPTYTHRLARMYKKLLAILNPVLPPSVKLVWGEQKTPCGMRADVLVSMEYTVRVNGEIKTFKQPIYCAEYKRVGSLMSLGMARVGSSLDEILEKESIKDDYQEYGGPSIVAWDNPQSVANKCGGGLRNANKSVRQAFVPPSVENALRKQVGSSSTKKEAEEASLPRIPGTSFDNAKDVRNMGHQFEKLVCVIAVGIGDGCSHSMALISRKKEDFVGWSELRYAPDEGEEEEEEDDDDDDDDDEKGKYVAPDSVSQATGMTGNLSSFYKQFFDAEKVVKQPKQTSEGTKGEDKQRPSLMFSDYLHMEDDENFVYKVGRGIVNVVAMNIVLNYYHRNFIPNDLQNEDERTVQEYMKKLTDSLGDDFKYTYRDILPKPVMKERKGNDDSDDGDDNDDNKKGSGGDDSKYGHGNDPMGSDEDKYDKRMEGSDGGGDDGPPPPSDKPCNIESQDSVGQHSHDLDNGLPYRYFLDSKARFQLGFMAYLKEQNTARWNFPGEPVELDLPDYQGIECEGRRTIRDSDGSFRYLIDISVNTIAGICNELEALSRIFEAHDTVKVAPEFIYFGFYSYKNIGIRLYTFFIHVKGVNGTIGRDSNESMNSRPIKNLKKTLLRKYHIKHRKLPRSHVIIQDSSAVAINFNNVRFTDMKGWSTRPLIKVVNQYIGSWSASTDSAPPSAVTESGTEGVEEPFRNLNIQK